MLAAILFIPVGINGISAQTILGGDNTDVGSTGHILLDITTLESYKLHPEITREMLEVLPGEQPLTVEFGQAYDEINLIGFGIEDHIRSEYVEFLEDLPITTFGKMGNALSVGIDPSYKDQLDNIKEQLEIMYPNVDTDVVIASTLTYHDTFSKTSTVNTAIPNGDRTSLVNTIQVTNHATLNSMTISITVDQHQTCDN